MEAQFNWAFLFPKNKLTNLPKQDFEETKADAKRKLGRPSSHFDVVETVAQ